MASGYWGHTVRRGEDSILDRMRLEERRAIARAAGRSIADIEEESNLAMALSASSPAFAVVSPPREEEEEESSSLRPLLDDDDESMELMSVDSYESPGISGEAGRLSIVPEEVLVRVLGALTPEAAAGTSTVCRVFARLATSETLCETHCRRIFSRCRPERWRGWRAMLSRRARVRTGGLYALRTSKWRQVKQDMFIPQDLLGTFHIEVVWWRFFRFFEDGRVAYSLLNTDTPVAAAARLLDNARSPTPKRKQQPDVATAFLGDYAVSKRDLHCVVTLPHARMNFDFAIDDRGHRGHFNALTLKSHTQSDVQGRFPIDHALPDPHTFFFTTIPAWA